MLEGKRIWLRALEPADVDVLYNIENDTDVWRVSYQLTPFSKHVLEQYVKSVDDIYAARQLRLMVCLKGERKAIGTIDLYDFEPFHQRAGVGVLIAADEHRRMGYAQETLEVLADYAFNILQLHQLYANVAVGNTSSVALFEKCGYTSTGIKKDWNRKSPEEWEDEHTMQLMREDWVSKKKSAGDE